MNFNKPWQVGGEERILKTFRKEIYSIAQRSYGDKTTFAYFPYSPELYNTT